MSVRGRSALSWVQYAIPIALLGLLLALTTSARAQDKSAVDPTRLKLPRGPGSLEGIGENAEVNPSMGLLSHRIPIEVPAGYAGLQPSVALDYSSGSGNSVVGIGWSLGMPAIERMTSKGLPQYTADDRLAADGSRELVRVSNAGDYRERFEGSFIRYRWVDSAGDGRDGYWIAEYPDGRVGYFGARANGSIVDNAVVRGADGTFRYHLVEVVDPLDHRLLYDYQKINGYPLLVRIAYAFQGNQPHYQIRFAYEARKDELSDAKPGFELRLTERLSGIRILVGSEQYRRYELSYDEGSGLSRLSRVVWFGTDESAGPHPIQFSFGYSEGLGETCGRSDCGAPHLVSYETGVGVNFAAGTADLVDLNGDALPDVIDTSGENHRFFINEFAQGAARFSAPISSSFGGLRLDAASTQMLDLDGDGFADMVDAATQLVLRNRGSADWSAQLMLADLNMPDLGADANARPLDLNNDGRIDILHSDGGSTWYYRNDGDAFIQVDADENIGAGFSEDGLKLADMNGDGLTDLVQLSEGLVSFRMNLGHGRFAAFRELQNAPSATTEFRLVDLNGDGLSDLVRAVGLAVEYALNHNSREFVAPVTLAASSSLPIPETDGSYALRFADMNGSGTTDVVWIDSSGKLTFLELFQSRPNLLTEIDNGIGRTIFVDYGSSVRHLASDGGEWEHRLPHPMLTVDEVRTLDAHSGQVAVRRFRYRDGYYDSKEKQFRGFQEVEITVPGDAFQETRVERLVFDVGAKDPYRKNLLIEQRVWSDARPLFMLRNTHDDCSLAGVPKVSPAVRSVCLERSVRTLQEGLEPSEWVTIEERFEYDGYGNTTLSSKLGVTSKGGGACGPCSNSALGMPCGSACSGDEQYEETAFVVPESEGPWMVRRPMRRRGYGALGSQKFTEERYYYDGEPFVGLPLGNLSRGLLVRTSARVQGDDFIDVSRYRYNAHGAVVEELDALGNRRLYAYDEKGLLPVSETALVDGYSLQMRVAHDPVLESVVRSSEWRLVEDGEFVTPERPSFYAYDTFGRITAIAQPGDTLESPTQEFKYMLASPVSRIVRMSRSEKDGPLDVWEADCFDGLGRKLQTVTRIEPDRYQVAGAVEYATNGGDVRIFEPFVSGSGACTSPAESAPFAEQRFDAEGRVTLAILPDAELYGTASEKRTSYRPLEVINYDEEDSAGGKHANTPTHTRSDGLGRPVAYVRMLSPNKAVATRFAYDELGRLATVVDPNGNVKRQTYDVLGRIVRVEDPDAGGTTYVYDAAGNRTAIIDARGITRRFEHDALGRVKAEWDEAQPDETRISFAYDRAEDCEVCTHAAGRLVQVEFPLEGGLGVDQYGYDERGNATLLVRTLEEQSFSFQSEYDNVNRMRAAVYPGGKRLEYEFDGAGRVTKIPGFVSEVTYAENGGTGTIALRNGVATTYEYDVRKRVSRVRTLRGTELLNRITLSRDRVGNVTGIDADGGPEHLPTAAANYDFDPLYRLRAATLDPGGDFEESLTYDYAPNGNLLRKVSSRESESPAHVGAYGYAEDGAGPNSVTRAGSLELGYDAAGNLARRGEDAFEWDFMGRLRRVTRNDLELARYAYGPALSRVKKVEGDHVTYYFSEDFEVRDGIATLGVSIDGRRYAEIEYPIAGPGLVDLAPATLVGSGLKSDPDAAYEARDAWFGQALRAGVFSGAEPPSEDAIRHTLAASARRLVSDPGDTGARFFHHDHLGSVSLVTDTKGREIARFLSYPYGAERFTTGGFVEQARFTGQERNRAAGLISFTSRPYEPRLGRWLRPDPLFVGDIRNCVENPNDCNVFGYVQGNPVSFFDPTGKQTVGEFIDSRGVASARSGNKLATFGWAFTRAAWDTFGAEGVSKVADTLISGRDDLTAMDVGSALMEATPAKALKWLAGGVARLGKAGKRIVSKLKKVKSTDPCPLNSFVPDTLVETIDGLKPIAALKVGDLVLAKDEVTGAVDWKPITAVIQSGPKPVLKLAFEKEHGGQEVILATATHPIWVTGRGWTSAIDLELGDSMISAQGELARLSAVLSAEHESLVYNLEVEGYHTYFVGEGQGWVHNCIQPELGRKLDYFFGRATGNSHNVARSQQMLTQLERIGLPDKSTTRKYLSQHLTDVLNDPTSIARIQDNGRVVRESFLTGPGGGVKVETVWEGDKLITGNIFGGN